jgi:Ulp1 family protease
MSEKQRTPLKVIKEGDDREVEAGLPGLEPAATCSGTQSSSLPSPRQRAALVKYQHPVGLHDRNLEAIVAYDFNIPITVSSFSTMFKGRMLNDEVINWILAWWRTEIGGGSGMGPTIPQTQPNLPRCYYTTTHFYTALTEGNITDPLRVSRWTQNINFFRDFDLMMIPVNIKGCHWYLAVIDFKNHYTITYDSSESRSTLNTKKPARPRTHASLMAWLRMLHGNLLGTPFPEGAWTRRHSSECMGHTPQQGNPGDPGLDCGFFTLAFAMEISLGRFDFDFAQDDIPAIRNWMAHTIWNYGESINV